MPLSVPQALGMSLPYSSSTPALYPGELPNVVSALACGLCLPPEKVQECVRAAKYLKNLLALDIKPRSIHSILPWFGEVCN